MNVLIKVIRWGRIFRILCKLDFGLHKTFDDIISKNPYPVKAKVHDFISLDRSMDFLILGNYKGLHNIAT